MHHAMSIVSGLESSIIVGLLRRRGESGGCGAMGCFFMLLFMGVVIFLILRGRADKREQLGVSKRPLPSGSLEAESHPFRCPFSKCNQCGASGDKMKAQWDGLRRVNWACSYCGNTQTQTLSDEELPLSARQRLGLEPQGGQPFQQGYPQGGNTGMGGGVGGLLTGMMIGNMLGGNHHHHHEDGKSQGADGDWAEGDGGESSSDWGEGDSSSDSGSDWGDFGGGSDGGDSW